MSDRIERCFARLQAASRTALIPFITAGDPLPDAVPGMMHALVAAGADVIELGMPFSDPMADGPVIQHADERALRHRVGVANVLEWVRQFRQQDPATPVVLMGYLNPIAIHGIDSFGREAVASGVDGVLVVDCPIEEDTTLAPLRAAGLKRILLVAPTTSEVRLQNALEAAEGYLYYVAFAGVTGAQKHAADDIAQRVGRIRQQGRVPVAVGFGIKDADGAKAIAAFADAVVIGSALVESLAGAGDAADARGRARAFLAPIRSALDSIRR